MMITDLLPIPIFVIRKIIYMFPILNMSDLMLRSMNGLEEIFLNGKTRTLGFSARPYFRRDGPVVFFAIIIV